MAIAVAPAVKRSNNIVSGSAVGAWRVITATPGRRASSATAPHRPAGCSDGVAESRLFNSRRNGGTCHGRRSAPPPAAECRALPPAGQKLAPFVHLLTHIQPPRKPARLRCSVLAKNSKSFTVRASRSTFGIVGQHLLMVRPGCAARQGPPGLSRAKCPGRAFHAPDLRHNLTGGQTPHPAAPAHHSKASTRPKSSAGARLASSRWFKVSGRSAMAAAVSAASGRRLMAHQRRPAPPPVRPARRPTANGCGIAPAVLLIVAIAPDFQLHRLAIGQRGAPPALPGMGGIVARSGWAGVSSSPRATVRRQGGRAVHQHAARVSSTRSARPSCPTIKCVSQSGLRRSMPASDTPASAWRNNTILPRFARRGRAPSSSRSA